MELAKLIALLSVNKAREVFEIIFYNALVDDQSQHVSHDSTHQPRLVGYG